MKLRVRGDSIRLRLTQDEVARIAQQRSVSESVYFGPGESVRLEYVLLVNPLATAVRARYAPGRISVELPVADALEWALTDRERIEARQPASTRSELRITVEKDYACLAARDPEEDAGAFPHPRAGEDVC